MYQKEFVKKKEIKKSIERIKENRKRRKENEAK